MRELSKREDKGYEVQWYDENGDNSRVVQMDTAAELAQYLARSLWGESRFNQNPTVWKDGKRWCFGEYTPVNDPKPCLVIDHTFDAMTDVYEYDTYEEAENALENFYRKYLQEEIDNNSDIVESRCYCDRDSGFAQIEWADKDKTFFTVTTSMREEEVR